MTQSHMAKAKVSIHAPASEVWRALTSPELIRQYLFGTEAVCDWNVGSPLTYKGEWKGKRYEDKGKILKADKDKLLVHTYWSSMSGKPDTSENYKTVRYAIESKGKECELSVSQDNNADQAEAEHSQKNWEQVLQKLKEVVEKKD